MSYYFKPRTAGYKFTIERKPALWLDPEKVTDLSKEYPKTIITFQDNSSGYVFWRWMPKNDEVIEIIKSLLSEPNSEGFRNKLKELLA
jgi:hypothetical protein